MSSEKAANNFYSIEDILNLPDPEWLIQDLLPRSSFAVLFGPPSVGKSFLALSLALAIAADESWLGREVKGGPVIYIAAEGFGGLKLRVAALLLYSNYPVSTECAFLKRPINFLEADEVQAFTKPIQDVRPALIIIDTLARCFVGGDENSAQQMGLFIDGVETVKRETGATVLVIHHTGKNEQRGARGSSALIGAADTIISCSGDINYLEIKCEKMKDAEPFKSFKLSAQTMELENGRKSIVLIPFDEAMAALGSPGKQVSLKKVLDILEQKFGSEGATATEWRKACEAEQMPGSTFNRWLKEAKNQGLVKKDRDGQGARYRVVNSEAVSVSADVKPVS